MSYFEIFPVEILTHIFMLVTHGDEKTSFSPYSVSCPVFDTTLVRTPVIISYVNCFWRHVTLNTPALWTSLCLTPEMILEDNDGENYLDRTFLDFFLVQSQMYPLDVLIKAQDPSWDYNRMEPECMLFMHNTDAMITYFLFLAYLLKQDQMFFCQFFFLTICWMLSVQFSLTSIDEGHSRSWLTYGRQCSSLSVTSIHFFWLWVHYDLSTWLFPAAICLLVFHLIFILSQWKRSSFSPLTITLFMSSTVTLSYQTSVISSFKVSMFSGLCLIWCWQGRTISALCHWSLITTVVMFAPPWRSSVSFYLRTLSSRHSRSTVPVQSSLIRMTMSLLPTTFVGSFTFLVWRM